MLKAKKLQITLFFNNSDICLNGRGTKIADLLGVDFTRKVALALKSLKLVYIEQLINEAGSHMITWQQLKLLQKQTCKGRQSKWFSKLETKLIEDKGNRNLKESWQIPNTNEHALKIQLEQISEDRRKHEWVLTKAKKKHENNNILIKRICKSTPKRVLTEHWIATTKPEVSRLVISKCKGCILDQKGKEEGCTRWENKKEIQGSLSNLIRK